MGGTVRSDANSAEAKRRALAKANGLSLTADLKPDEGVTTPAAPAKAPAKAPATAAPAKAAPTKAAPAAPAPTFAPFKLLPVGKAAEAAPAPAEKK